MKNIHQASEIRDQLVSCQSQKKTFKPSITCLGRHIHVFNEDYLLSHVLDVAASVVSGNFSQDALGDWYMNLVIDIDRSDYVKSLVKKGFSEIAPQEIIGIDPGSKTMLGCSDGTIIEPPQFYRQAEQKLASLQKNGRKKQAKRLHRDVKRQRDDFNQKLTTNIVKENQTIKYGNLNVKGLVKRKKSKKRRTAPNSNNNNNAPSKEALQKGKTTKTPRSLRLAKSLLDNGLGQVKMLLSVKSHWAGRAFHEVNEKYTTQVCSNCDAFTGPKGLKQLVVRTWVCSVCETEHQRDVCSGQNLARVIPGQILLTSVPRCGHLFAEMKHKRFHPFLPDTNPSA